MYNLKTSHFSVGKDGSAIYFSTCTGDKKIRNQDFSYETDTYKGCIAIQNVLDWICPLESIPHEKRGARVGLSLTPTIPTIQVDLDRVGSRNIDFDF